MKNLSIVSVVIVFLMAGLGIASAAGAPEEALVLYLSFDEDDGNVVVDKGPHGFEANLQGDYKWVKDGKVNGAMEFTQGSAIVPDDDRLDVEQITLMAWIFPTSISQETTTGHNIGSMFYDKSGSSDDSVEFSLIGGDGAFLYINSGSGGDDRMGPFNGADVDTTLALPDMGIQENKWQHITGTFDGTDIKIYLDGDLAGEQAVPGDNPSIVWNDNNAEIGGRPDQARWYVGILDEFAIFDRALTEDEIDRMMRSLTAVELSGKLTTTWAEIKVQN